MLFGLIILALVASIAFFHYVQGLFSAMLSATLVIFAALLAVSYHEWLAESLFADAFPNQAHAVALVGLFGFLYVMMRLLTDRVVPGNVRMPVLVDKIGAGFFGVIAGIFGGGILAIAAQLLPMGPSIAGYARFEVEDREVSNVVVSGRHQMQDVVIANEMVNSSMSPDRASSLFPLAADSLTLGLVKYVSNGGSLAGTRSFTAIHPSYLDELFGHRVGPLRGSDVAIGFEGNPRIRVAGAYSTAQLIAQRSDFELEKIRADKTPVVDVSPTAIPVAVRVSLDPPTRASNPINPASVRVVVNGVNHFPIGTFQRGEVLLLTRPDDYLFIEAQNPVDFVYMIEGDYLPFRDGSNERVFPEGSFVQARRAARTDLSGMPIGPSVPLGSRSVGVIEKDRAAQR